MTRTPVPSRWDAVPVGELAELVQYGSSAKTNSDNNGVPVLRMGNILNGRLVFDDLKYLPSDHEEFPQLLLQPGDLLFNRTNSPELVGKTAVYNGEISPCSFASYLIRVRLSGAEPGLVAAYINSPYGRDWIREVVRQQVGQANVNGTKLKALEIPLPPTGLQRQIVEKIEALTAKSRRAKEALDAIPPLLERFRQSVLAAAFRGDLTKDWREQHPDVEPADQLLARIRRERRKRWEEAELEKMRAKGKVPKDDEWKKKYVEPKPVDPEGLPELPEGWCWAAWRELGFCQNGRAFPSNEYASTGFRLLRPGNLHSSGRVVWTTGNTKCMPAHWADEYPEHIVGGRELLINLTAQSLKDAFLGRVCLTSAEDRCLLNQRIARLTPVGLTAEFAFWVFRTPIFRHYVDQLNTGSLIQHMFTSQVDEFNFPLPPANEQAEIVAKLRHADAHAAQLEEALAGAGAVSKQLDASILAKAFRGELMSPENA